MRRTIVPSLLALALLTACDAEDPQRAAARTAARRDRCIAEELAVQAGTQIATMDTLSSGGSAIVNLMLPFARAFYDFAKARERELALMDSALAATSATDSAELAGRAARARPRAPASEVEVNAAQDYQRRFAEALGNPNHPCNTVGEEE